MAVGGAEYGGHDDLHPVTDEEVAELADGELLVDFYRCGKRRVNAAEVGTTNLCGAVSEPLKRAPAAAAAPEHAIASALGQPFTTSAIAAEPSKPVPAVAPSLTAEKPSELPKSQLRIRGEASAKSATRRRQPLPFLDTSSMLRLHAEGRYAFDVEGVLQNFFSVEHSSDIPAEVLAGLLTRIGLDEKGIAAIRTELGAKVMREEHERGCVVLGSESLADNDGKVLIQFEDLPHVSAHAPYPVAADTKRDPAEPITSAPAVSVSLATKSGTETKALDSVITSALGQMDKPFTPGAIAAEAPNPLETDHSATCFKNTLRAEEDAEKRAEREAAIDAIMKQLE
jgi:hypothetical protein